MIARSHLSCATIPFSKLVITLLLVVLGIQPAVAIEVKIKDLPALVKDHNRDVKIAEVDVKVAEAGVDIARARYFPSLSWDSKLIHMNDDLVIKIPQQTLSKDIFGGNLSVNIPVDLPSFKVKNQEFLSSQLTMTQPLFTGYRITAGLDAAQSQKQEAKINTAKTTDDKLLEAMTRYFQVQYATEVTSALESVSADLDDLYRMSESLVRTGVVPKFALYKLTIAREEVAAKLASARNGQKLAMEVLKVDLDILPAEKVVLLSPLKMLPLEVELVQSVSQALTDRPEFAILKEKEKQVAALKTAQVGAMWPTVFLFGKYEVAKEDLTALDPEWVVGLGVNMSLTSPLTQLPERERAAQMAAKVELTHSKAMKEIPLQVESYYSECGALQASMKALDRALEASEEALRLAKIRYKSGGGSALELTTAAADLEKVKIERLQTIEKYNRSLMGLYWASGRVKQYIGVYGG